MNNFTIGSRVLIKKVRRIGIITFQQIIWGRIRYDVEMLSGGFRTYQFESELKLLPEKKEIFFKHKDGCEWGNDINHMHLVPIDCYVPEKKEKRCRICGSKEIFDGNDMLCYDHLFGVLPSQKQIDMYKKVEKPKTLWGMKMYEPKEADPEGYNECKCHKANKEYIYCHYFPKGDYCEHCQPTSHQISITEIEKLDLDNQKNGYSQKLYFDGDWFEAQVANKINEIIEKVNELISNKI